MSDILEDLRLLQASIANLNKRIEKIENDNRFTASTDWAQSHWWGRCSPSQPADRFLQVGGGILWWWQDDTQVGYFSKLDRVPYSFFTASPFNNADYYRWCVLQADVSAGIADFHLYEDNNEFATADACENDFWVNAPGDNLYGSYIPLCALVLRNDGLTAVAGAIENITLHDKTQSYILVRDFRPWLHLHKELGA